MTFCHNNERYLVWVCGVFFCVRLLIRVFITAPHRTSCGGWFVCVPHTDSAVVGPTSSCIGPLRRVHILHIVCTQNRFAGLLLSRPHALWHINLFLSPACTAFGCMEGRTDGTNGWKVCWITLALLVVLGISLAAGPSELCCTQLPWPQPPGWLAGPLHLALPPPPASPLVPARLPCACGCLLLDFMPCRAALWCGVYGREQGNTQALRLVRQRCKPWHALLLFQLTLAVVCVRAFVYILLNPLGILL